MNNVFNLLCVGAFSFGLLAANAEAPRLRKKKKDATEQADTVKKEKVSDYKKLLKDAKTTEGMFKIHQVKDKYYFEIPKNLLKRDFMISSRVSSTSNNKA